MSACLLALSLPLTGLACAAGERSPADPVPPPDSFSVSGTEERPDRWWTAFGQPALDAAVDEALASNLELRAAWQRLEAARAVADRTAAGLLPAVDASMDAVATRPAEGEAGESFGFDVAASYEVDLWGRIRSRTDAERLRAGATAADYRTAALTLSAEVARSWAELAEASSQVALVDRQLNTNRTVLELLETRFRAGLIRAVDVLRQRQLIQATLEQRTLALQRRELAEHRLAVLLGRPPQNGPGHRPPGLPELPPLPAAGVPLDLVRRRPDVRSAFLRLRAADRDVAAAISDRFPRLSLSASAATGAASARDLFQDWVRTLGGNLLAPLFYGGELAAEVDRARAVREQRLLEYGQAALTAFQDVEDALVRETGQRERVRRVRAQVELARQAYDQLRVQYFNGTTDYLDVLTALTEVQSLERDLLSGRRSLVDARISLYRALAGGFETRREEAAADVAGTGGRTGPQSQGRSNG